MKIVLNIGTIREEKSVDIDPLVLAKAEQESRWQIGTALIGGVQRLVQRKKQLDEWIYRFQEQLLDPKCIEGYRQDEWIEWRDA